MIAAQVLPVSLSIPEKLLTVDDPVPKEPPKELVKQPKNQAKYNTRSKPKPEGETLVISDPDKCVSNINYPSFESVLDSSTSCLCTT